MCRIPTSVLLFALAIGGQAGAFDAPLRPFFDNHCAECHDDVTAKGGLDLFALGTDLSDDAIAAKWERIFDRVAQGEMPPKDEPRPAAAERNSFSNSLGKSLMEAHAAKKGTVLRRLNRREYENTINDLFGTHVRVADLLPEDGRSHEFDNVGDALSVSMVQMQRYLEAARLALDEAIATRIAPVESARFEATFRESEVESQLGKNWMRLPDGALVRFSGGGYPSGLLREGAPRTRGWYTVKVTGYAYQSKEPVVCSIGGESYQRGSAKPVYTYAAFPPGKPTTIELKTWIEPGYMLVIEPQGIFLPRPRPDSIDDYEGPGFAFVSAWLEGPLAEEFPSRGQRLIFDGIDRLEVEPRNPAEKQKSWYQPKFEIVSQNPATDAAIALKRVAAAAWRRPVEDDGQIAPYLKLFESELELGSTFEEALRASIAAILCSPDFLYLLEKPGFLDDFALASRLSYFLNRTAPDQQLLTAAAAGRLAKDPNTLVAECDRLLASDHAERFIVDFTDAWLDLRDIEFTAPDRSLFPEFDPFLQHSMIDETRLFFRELIAKNLSVASLVKSDFAMLNSRLAEHYGVDGVTGPEIRRVSLPAGSPRGGFLSQGAVLKVSANGTNTSPVVRGVWVIERILGITPQPPPPGIPGVEPDIRGATTLRELLDKHRDAENCRACHAVIDPPGFALESFDPIGGWRDRFRSLGEGDRPEAQVEGVPVRYKLGQPVDAGGVLPDGREFAGYLEFRDLLAAEEDRLAKAFATKLLTFATGREPGFSDRAEIERIVQKSAAQGHGIRDLLHLVVTSEIFRSK